MVTSYRVENGSGRLGSGVKIRIVVPDHRNVPATAGEILKKGARTTDGMRPRATIGSENTIRTSLVSARLPTSPVGPALTICSGLAVDWAAAVPLVAARHITRLRARSEKARIMGWTWGGERVTYGSLDTPSLRVD